MSESVYDICIIGGGLAGLAMAVQGVQQGYTVVLAEKETYPFHKVCGEYISMESWDFLEGLGVPLATMKLPRIRQLTVSAPDGASLTHPLPLGGFGISRYKLDKLLRDIAVEKGATVLENCKADQVMFENEQFTIVTTQGKLFAKVCCGSFGKRSNLDIKWQRPFALYKAGKLHNFIGVKYHIRLPVPADMIALHNFKDGYCGISQVEEDRVCLCYLTTAQNLARCGNSIAQLEQQVLQQNPFLKAIFSEAEMLYEKPLTISQVSFSAKTQVQNHVLLLGDAAGMITPLCGNGMSMALHSSKLAFAQVHGFLLGHWSRAQMEAGYTSQWKKIFSKRLLAGRMVQRLFGKKWTTNLLVATLKRMPGVLTRLVRLTHGEPF